jgi:hypothetical protein
MLTALCRNMTMDAPPSRFAGRRRLRHGARRQPYGTRRVDFELNFTLQVQLAIAGAEGVTLPVAPDKKLGLCCARDGSVGGARGTV